MTYLYFGCVFQSPKFQPSRRVFNDHQCNQILLFYFYLLFFSCPFFSSHYYPLMVVALLCITHSSYLGLLHSSQLLNGQLGPTADSVSQVARLLLQNLLSRIYDMNQSQGQFVRAMYPFTQWICSMAAFVRSSFCKVARTCRLILKTQSHT